MSDEQASPRVPSGRESAPRELGILTTLFATSIDIREFWNWYEVIAVQGMDEAYQMARAAVLMAMGERELSCDQEARLRTELEHIAQAHERSVDRRRQALGVSYAMLASGGTWTWARAARLATSLLGKQTTPEAWRKAVNQWARDEGKPTLSLAHGRRKKNRK